MATFHEQCEDAMDIIKNKGTIRRFVKSMDLRTDDIERISNRFLAIKDEIAKEEEALLQAEKEKEEKIAKISQEMKELGLNPEDLAYSPAVRAAKRARGPSPLAGKKRENPKYVFEYEDENGTKKQLKAGLIGRVPSDFSDYLKKTGKARKDCIVEKA